MYVLRRHFKKRKKNWLNKRKANIRTISSASRFMERRHRYL